jgi:hypothetical protein
MTAQDLRRFEIIEEIEAEHDVRTQQIMAEDHGLPPLAASIRAITLMLREARSQQCDYPLRLCL